MWRRIVSGGSRHLVANGVAGAGVVALVAYSLQIDDSAVTDVDPASNGVWLQVESTGELVEVDPYSGASTNRVSVTDPRTAVEVIDTDELVAVVGEASGELVTVDPALGVVSDRTSLGIEDVSDVHAAEQVWAIGSGGAVRIESKAAPALVELTGPASSSAPDGDGLAVVVDSVRVDVDGSGSAIVGSPSPDLVVTAVGDDVATIVPSEGEVRLDDGTVACVPGPTDETTVWGGSSSGPRIVVGAHSSQGTVHTSLIDDDLCRDYPIVDGPASFSRPLVVDGVLYVADTATGRLHIVDLASGVDTSARLFRAAEEVELLHRGDYVIAHEPRTFNGAAIGPDGVIQVIDKSANRPPAGSHSDEDEVAASGDEPLGPSTSVIGALQVVDDELATSDEAHDGDGEIAAASDPGLAEPPPTTDPVPSSTTTTVPPPTVTTDDDPDPVTTTTVTTTVPPPPPDDDDPDPVTTTTVTTTVPPPLPDDDDDDEGDDDDDDDEGEVVDPPLIDIGDDDDPLAIGVSVSPLPGLGLVIG